MFAELFRDHEQAEVIESLPGMGPLLGAEFLVAVGDIRSFPNRDHTAAFAGLAPVPRDSGRRTGVLHRPQPYNRMLRRVMYLSAMASLKAAGPSRDYYDRKRGQGHNHVSAVIRLARRRSDVLWAMLHSYRPFTIETPVLGKAGACGEPRSAAPG